MSQSEEENKTIISGNYAGSYSNRTYIHLFYWLLILSNNNNEVFFFISNWNNNQSS